MADCIFCKIVKGEIPSKKLYEDDDILAFEDIAPQAPVHFLVIPKRHISNLMEIEENDAELMGRLIFIAKEIASKPVMGSKEGCAENGGRFIFNCKSHGGQTENHIHLHFLGGKQLALHLG